MSRRFLSTVHYGNSGDLRSDLQRPTLPENSAHAAVGRSELELLDEELSENVLGRCFYKRGDCAAALAASDAVVEARFETSWIHQGYIEPQAATAWVEGDELVVSSSTQGVSAIRDQLAELFAIPSP